MAVERLYRAKERDSNLAVPLIAGSLEQAVASGTFTDADVRLARAFWPGPLSIVVPASAILSARLVGPRATVAVRVPAHPVARGLALALGCAITSSSANRSGMPAATSANETVAALADHLDAVIDAGASPVARHDRIAHRDGHGCCAPARSHGSVLKIRRVTRHMGSRSTSTDSLERAALVG